MKHIKILAALLALSCLPLATYAAHTMSNRQAKALMAAAFRHTDSSALARLIKAARTGDPVAEKWLGAYYDASENGPKAAYWYRKAAEQGIAKEKTNLRQAPADRRTVKEQVGGPLKLFGVNLKGITRDRLEPVLTKAGLTPRNGHVGAKWRFDEYDVNGRLKGASELAVGYTSDNRFALAEYTFPSVMDPGQVRRIINMVKMKYGQPSSVNGPYGLGNVTAYWDVGDGMRVEVKRGWPDTTTYLDLIDVKAYAAMKQSMAKQKAKQKAGQAKEQNSAF